VAVMYLGELVEQGTVRQVIKSPAHPYTRGLINALPKLDELDQPLTPIPGDIPSPLERPAGCVFHTRCPVAEARCSESLPGMKGYGEGHVAACFVTSEEGAKT
ncbi:MAG: ABC transporter ATP-binding protein, partial [Gammaproteobacteria bacterium]|nr:ABC transporter ATP-binding protein [Gammaproteobacteria bacterium]